MWANKWYFINHFRYYQRISSRYVSIDKTITTLFQVQVPYSNIHIPLHVADRIHSQSNYVCTRSVVQFVLLLVGHTTWSSCRGRSRTTMAWNAMFAVAKMYSHTENHVNAENENFLFYRETFEEIQKEMQCVVPVSRFQISTYISVFFQLYRVLWRFLQFIVKPLVLQ